MAPCDLAPTSLSDRDLLAEVARLAACERAATASLVALLAEVDARQLHLAEGCSSLFAYCTERLHLSEHAAYHRIEAARAVRLFPVILEHLRSGALTVTAVTLLRSHLTEENHQRLLDAACGHTKREVELLVRSVAPLPDVRASVRKLPMARDSHPSALGAVPASSTGIAANPAAAEQGEVKPSPNVATMGEAGPTVLALDASAVAETDHQAAGSTKQYAHAPSLVPRRAEVKVLSPERYSLRVTLSAEAHSKLRRAQDLMRHTVPDGDPAAIVERALALLVEQLERRKFAAKKEKRRREVRVPSVAQTLAPAEAATLGSAATSPVAEHGTEDKPPGSLSSVVRDEHGTDRGKAQASIGRVRVAEPGGGEVRCSRTARTGRPAAGKAPRSSRHIPACVKREVWARDEGRCAFIGAGGRCRQTGRLEFHHRLPVADGGEATVHNLELRCTTHHRRESGLWFGENGSSAMNQATRPGPRT